ncbi:hypothetical protein BDSB_10955 [Burkholderia dolosa PC543]|nr:hypothetical protein BDSB_10955 [Burkholderia dolosa PC543]
MAAVLVVLFRILAVEPVRDDFAIGDRTDAVALLQLRSRVLVEVDAAVPHAIRTQWIEPVFGGCQRLHIGHRVGWVIFADR